MTMRRCLEKNAIHKITRRADQAAWLFAPCLEWKIIHDAFAYCLAWASRETSVQIVAAVLMSNHYHIVAVDPECRLSEFLRIVNESMARFVNEVHGKRRKGTKTKVRREGPVWSPTERCCIQPIMDCADIVEDILYVVCNPTCEGGVYDPTTWPGFVTSTDLIGSETAIETRLPKGLVLPRSYKCPRKQRPDTLDLHLVVPPGLCPETLHKDLALRREVVLADRRKGVKKWMKHYRVEKPKRLIPKKAKKTGRAHSFICRDPERRKKVLKHFRDWVAEYDKACRIFRRDKNEALFPHGTYGHRVVLNVKTADPPDELPPYLRH